MVRRGHVNRRIHVPLLPSEPGGVSGLTLGRRPTISVLSGNPTWGKLLYEPISISRVLEKKSEKERGGKRGGRRYVL